MPVVKRPPTFDRNLMLWCIAEIESRHNDAKIGPAGERSKYQFLYSVWLQHADRMIQGKDCFDRYCNALVADALAKEHLDWIVSRVGANPFAVVASWHLGVTGSKRRWTAKARDHIDRTVRLYRTMAGG